MTDDPIDRTGLPPRYWETKPLSRMTRHEWEALCDGCGKCCLNKLEDEDTGEVELTCVACRLFDNESARCARYETRHHFVPECITLTVKNIEKSLYWLPNTCAYKLLWQGKPLYPWHPLISGTAQTVHDAGVSMLGRTVSEAEIDEDDWEDHVIEEPI